MQNLRLIATIFILTIVVVSFNSCKRTINPALTDQFVKAAYDGDIVKIQKLYDEGADINAESKGNYGHTALTTSANSGKIVVVEFLLKKGADINQKNSMKSTALGTAITGGQVEVVKFLIAKGANVNEDDGYGHTHITRLEQWQKDYPTVTKWPELIEILKKAGAK